MIVVRLIFLTIYLWCGGVAAVKPGPKVIATRGEIWPKPQYQEKYAGYFVLRPTVFSFQTEDRSCDILNDAITRYQEIITFSGSLERRGALSEIINRKYRKPWLSDAAFLGYIDSLFITFDGSCDQHTYPQHNMSENYSLNVTDPVKVLLTNSIWGVLRGLETFSQLVHLANDEVTLIVNATFIQDFPRFGHRGLLIDTARHFIPVHTLLNMLDAMAYNKMNVFHWHITDDQSFPYKSYKFPELSEYGAFHPKTKVYEPDDVQYVIEYARRRGIRVLPEFDTPGHTMSWGEGIKELLTVCYDMEGKPNGENGPIDPTNTNFTYEILTEFFSEIVDVFPESYLHLGGDEVSFDCWKSNPNITEFMEQNGISTYEELESYYIDRLLKIAHGLEAKTIVWEEVFVNGVNLPNDTIVHVWKDAYPEVLFNATKSGKPVLLSSCWYLDHLASGGDWNKFYNCEPLCFNGTASQDALVLGGEAAMWAEVVNEFNIAARIWPRASAVAERLWSNAEVQDMDDAEKRLEEHTCRMNNRGVGAQPPNGPGFCL